MGDWLIALLCAFGAGASFANMFNHPQQIRWPLLLGILTVGCVWFVVFAVLGVKPAPPASPTAEEP